MRASQKVAIINAIAREMKRRYSYEDIDIYFEEFKIRLGHSPADFQDESVYAKFAMRGIKEETLIQIAEDLEIDTASTRGCHDGQPENMAR